MATNNGGEQNLQQEGVLTLVLKIEYNGFRYAGFQRQTATFGNTNCINDDNNNRNYNIGSKSAKRKRTTCDDSKASFSPTNSKASTFPNTIQHQLEMAIQKYTNLSLSTLRLRGAGRTDAGVHATGQVVAFDIPIRSLRLGLEGIGDNNDEDGNKHDHLASLSNFLCKEEEEEKEKEEENEVDDVNVQSSVNSAETLSEHCIQHFREAYQTLVRHLYSQASINQKKAQINHNDISAKSSSNSTKDRTKFVAADQWQIRRALITRLPSDIVVRSVRVYTAGEIEPFEPRKGVKCKTYVYKLRFRRLSNIMGRQHDTIIHPICNSGPHLLRRITDQNTVWLCPWALDPVLLSPSCSALVGKHDFVNFVHKDERKKRKQQGGLANGLPVSPVHEVDLFDFNVTFTQSEEDAKTDDGGDEDDEKGEMLPPVMDATFTLRARGFQRSMVRNLVGFVVDVSRGLRSLDDIPVLLLEKDEEKLMNAEDDCVHNKCRSSGKDVVVNSAPACGLCLAEVEYDHHNFV